MSTTLRHPDGLVHIEQPKTGKNKLSIELLNKKVFMPRSTCETSYPVDLIERILNVKGIGYLCDEIMRDEDPMYVEHSLKYDMLSYVDQDSLDKKRILDFGCGSGASTMVLARMFPNSEMVGVELEDQLLSIAKMRAKHYEFHNVSFIRSPTADDLPSGLGDFDYAVLSAVYEHLLTNERQNLLPKIWSRLKPGGVLFINQTPYRYFPIESHTTGLPLINYLPYKAALYLATRFSKRVSPDDDWETLLRRGIRGGTVQQIMKILRATSYEPVLLEPDRPGIKDRIDLWYRLSGTTRLPILKKFLMCLLKTFKLISGVTVTPSLSLAIKKSHSKS
ncbi:MAG: class I SAM-dependent methyltransferase [Sedimentisphaerales bacterium]|nr:class I SAM-dependent methyltransferase [Sedimentisphaerales bacterium]